MSEHVNTLPAQALKVLVMRNSPWPERARACRGFYVWCWYWFRLTRMFPRAKKNTFHLRILCCMISSHLLRAPSRSKETEELKELICIVLLRVKTPTCDILSCKMQHLVRSRIFFLTLCSPRSTSAPLVIKITWYCMHACYHGENLKKLALIWTW